MSTNGELQKRIDALESENQFLRNILNTIPVMVYAKDLNSTFIFANKAIADSGGFQSPEEMIGKSDFDFHPQELAETYHAREQAMLANEASIINLEERVVHQDGSGERWYLSNKIPLVEDGQVRGFVGVGYDVTDYKLQEQHAKERDILRQMIDHLPDSMFVKDAEGRYIMGNSRQVYFSGKETLEDIIGLRDIDLYPEYGDFYYQAEMELIHSGDPIINREEVVIDPDTGGSIALLVTKIPIKDDDGKPIGIVGIGRDVTEWKALQASQEQQRKIIEQQQQTLRDLSAPIIPITDEIIIMPLIGSVDGERAQIIMRSLLAGISQYDAQFVIIDLTGVPLVDSEVAGYLHRSIQAIKLKGARPIITGITEEIAETVVDLGIDWSGIETWRDLQSGIQRVIS